LAARPFEAGPFEAGPFEAGPFEAGPFEAGPFEAGPFEAGPLMPSIFWDVLVVTLPLMSSFTALAFLVVLSALIRLFFSIVISLGS
jgi:hypothetical protein